MIFTDKSYVSFIYRNACYYIMKVSIGQAYNLKCECGHEFIQHIGNAKSFAYNVHKENCMDEFFHVRK